jgi:tetratricopeptide (TPR) repeat protein
MTTQVRRLAAHKDASSTTRILPHTVSEPQVRDLQEAPTQLRSGSNVCVDTRNEREILRHLKEVVMRNRQIGLTLFILFLSSQVSVEAQTPDAAKNHYQDGIRNFASGNLDAAIEDYTRAIEISSRLAPTKSDRTRSRNTFESTPETDRITVIDPFTAWAYTNRGIARYRKGDADGAIADLDQAIRISPALAEAYLGRGVARRAVGDSKGAMTDFERALSINHNLAEAYNNRADIRLDLDDIDGALDDLNRSLALKPRLPETYYQLGYARMARQDLDGAIANFDRAIQLKPEMGAAYQGRGTARMRKSEFEGALVDFDRALELNPALTFAHMNRGLTLLLQGKDAEAQKDFEQCLALKPDVKAELERRISLAKELRVARDRPQ